MWTCFLSNWKRLFREKDLWQPLIVRCSSSLRKWAATARTSCPGAQRSEWRWRKGKRREFVCGLRRTKRKSRFETREIWVWHLERVWIGLPSVLWGIRSWIHIPRCPCQLEVCVSPVSSNGLAPRLLNERSTETNINQQSKRCTTSICIGLWFQFLLEYLVSDSSIPCFAAALKAVYVTYSFRCLFRYHFCFDSFRLERILIIFFSKWITCWHTKRQPLPWIISY